MSSFNFGPKAYKCLHGLLCVYKPADLSVMKMVNTIKFNLSRDLNALPCYKVELEMKNAHPDFDSKSPMVLDSTSPVPIEQSLVLGQRYIPSDIGIQCIHPLSHMSSGVLVMGIGKGISKIRDLAMSRYLRVYHVRGRFGWATNDFTTTGKIIERTSYRHINQIKLDKVLASMQSTYLRNMFDYAGVHRHSQDAYELAVQGLVRPEHSHTGSILYSIKCIEFDLPDFTLEIHAINEHCLELQELMNNIALHLRSSAVCTGIRRLRYGPLDTSHALLRQQWNLEEVVANLRQNKRLMKASLMAGEGPLETLHSGEDGDGRAELEAGSSEDSDDGEVRHLPGR